MNKLRDDFCKETNTSMGLDNVYDYVEWLELKINKQAEDKQLKLCEVGVELPTDTKQLSELCDNIYYKHIDQLCEETVEEAFKEGINLCLQVITNKVKR